MKKSKTRIFINKAISSNLLIYLKGKQLHFLKNVMRVKINDEIDVFDGLTGEWKALIMSINRDTIVLKVKNLNKKYKKNNDVWLIFSPIKQHRMSIAIQKATELDVSRIIPCITEFTNLRKINIKSLYENAIEAAEQSQRLDIPKIDNEININEMLEKWPKDRKIIFCDEKIEDNQSVIEKLSPIKNFLNKSAVFIGPEGGFSNKERDILRNNKEVISVSLGDKVLRSDTAITVALFSIQQLLS